MTNPRVEHEDVAARVFATLETLVAGFSEIKGCEYEHAPTEAPSLPCVTMQTLGGDPIEKRYLDGSRIAAYRFSLQLRQQTEDDQGRLDARSLLERLASEVERAAIDLGAGRALGSLVGHPAQSHRIDRGLCRLANRTHPEVPNKPMKGTPHEREHRTCLGQ